MKLKRLTTAILVFGCAEPLSPAPETAITPAEDKPVSPANEPEPRISFEKTTCDLGLIGPGTENLCEFKFTNTGKGLLKMGKVQATCGCTVPELPKDEYAPGESGTLKVKYHSSKYPGRETRRLFVYSNDKTKPNVELDVTAEIAKKVKFEPTSMNLLLNKENAGCGEITLTSLDDRPFAIKGFKSTVDSITADIDPSVEATRFVLQPKANIKKLEQTLAGGIEISLTHPQCDKVVIPFNVLPRFKTEPASIIVFNVEPNKPSRKELWVLNNYNEDFEVESVSAEKDIVKVVGREKIGNRYKFELEIAPPPPAEDKQKMFIDSFYVNIKGGEKLKVKCRGFYMRG
jgi:hypothetical protein